MPRPAQSTTSRTADSTSWQSAQKGDTTTTSRSRAGRKSSGRTSTGRPRTGVSAQSRSEAHEVICAVSESRGISPTVGLAFLNLNTCEAVLCQISDSQTYVRTVHKLQVYMPSQILIVSSASNPKSKLLSIIEENLDVLESDVVLLDRRYWAETTGLEYIQRLTLAEDVDAIKIAADGSYFAICCIAAVSLTVKLLFIFLLSFLGLQVCRACSRQNLSSSFPEGQI